ncbi:MAG: glycosyltransferase family 4 protein [Actinomycetota bacterium]|nr:glycosyltransferase family 4 protein [Actinomycetota bacterium]
MQVAMYAPLKPPDHPAPSGDRQMARLLMTAMRAAGHEVALVSRLRSYSASPLAEALGELEAKANLEAQRIEKSWQAGRAPDLWLTYHPYYKAPDLLGPPLCARHAVPYVTAEASYSSRRDRDAWAPYQAHVAAAIRRAALNICFTQRDRDGLSHLVAARRLAQLPPFIDTEPFAAEPQSGASPTARLITVAMLRKGDKLRSFRMLAEALELLLDLRWQLTIIGGGAARDEVRAMFKGLGTERVVWLGELAPESVAQPLYGADLYVWPGCGEAYGLAYLEAQAAGLPVIAQETAGVPEVVRSGTTGLLTREGDVGQYAQAIRRLIVDADRRRRMARAARAFVCNERSLAQATARLGTLLLGVVEQKSEAARG